MRRIAKVDPVKEKISQRILAGEFYQLYEELDAMSFDYLDGSFPEFQKDEDFAMKFAYFQYALTRNESVKLHIRIFEELYFGDRFFLYVWPVMEWHLRRALEIFPDSVEVLWWILHFADTPDHSFSEAEIVQFEESFQANSKNEEWERYRKFKDRDLDDINWRWQRVKNIVSFIFRGYGASSSWSR